jgi:hypothetical protein
MRGPLHPGPVPRTDGPVTVSLTEFTAHRMRDLPGIARAGIALSRAWWAMPGAIGVVLYVDPITKTGGSLSIWESEADLRRFVALPRHTAIMRRYRDRVDVRATTWTAENFSVTEAMKQRGERLPAAGVSAEPDPLATP